MQDGVIESEWLSQFQGGPDSSMPIVEKEDLSKVGGDTVVFTVGSSLVGDGKLGSNRLIGNEELQALNTYSCKVDFVRHAVAADKRFQAFTAAQRKAAFSAMLVDWMALRKQSDGLLSLVKSGGYTSSGIANNLMYAGGVSDEADLTQDNVLDTAFFQDVREKMVTLGARQSNVSRQAGRKIPLYVMWAGTRALKGLKNDAAWLNAAHLALLRGSGTADDTNPIFTGSFDGKYIEGIAPFEVLLPDHDNPANGAIGSPLEPRALTRTALTPSTATGVKINLGGSDATSAAILYAKWFPGYDYLFTSEQTAAPDSNLYHALIINPPGTTDAGKRELVSYTGSDNDGNSLTVNRGLNSGKAGYTGTHAANSLVVPCTSNGVPYANVIVAGAWALLRAYGQSREQLASESQDYGFVKGGAIESVYGQTPARRRDGKYANFCLGRVAIKL